MKNKSRPLVLGLVAIGIALIVVFVQYNAKNNKTTYTTTQPADQQSSTTVSTPKSTTTKTVTSQTNPNEYTLAQVATHNTPANCWTAINGGVYNVTSWISQHPGGSQAIINLCGIDGSAAFNDQHGGERRPASELASFKIGTLK